MHSNKSSFDNDGQRKNELKEESLWNSYTSMYDFIINV